MTAPGVHISGRLMAGGAALVRDIDLRLPAGRWSALLGPSGVGKTSLLRLMADLPSAARLEGEITVSDGAPLAPRISMMAQDDQLLPWASALENVTIGARLRGQPPRPARAAALLADVGLKGLERRKPSALSAGQRQRVALARTLYEDRPVVLLDEPFSALDAVTRHAVQDMSAHLLSGRTVLLITHDPAEAIRLADAAWIVTRAGSEAFAPPSPPPPRAPDAAATLAAQADLLERMRPLFAAAA